MLPLYGLGQKSLSCISSSAGNKTRRAKRFNIQRAQISARQNLALSSRECPL